MRPILPDLANRPGQGTGAFDIVRPFASKIVVYLYGPHHFIGRYHPEFITAGTAVNHLDISRYLTGFLTESRYSKGVSAAQSADFEIDQLVAGLRIIRAAAAKPTDVDGICTDYRKA